MIYEGAIKSSTLFFQKGKKGRRGRNPYDFSFYYVKLEREDDFASSFTKFRLNGANEYGASTVLQTSFLKYRKISSCREENAIQFSLSSK